MLNPSVTREKQHPQSLKSRKRRQSGSTNRGGCWTLKCMGSFTPLVFGTSSGLEAADCTSFFKPLAETLSEKNEEPYHITITWIRTLLSFQILRLVHIRVRGSRTPFHKIPQGDFIDDCRLNASEAGVF